MPSQRSPRLVLAYALQVVLLVLSGVLLLSSYQMVGLVLLVFVSILNFRLLALRNRRAAGRER